MDEEVDTSSTRQSVYIEIRLCLPSAKFRKQSSNRQIAMSVGICPLSNQLIPLPINDDTDVSGGNGVSVSESKVSGVSAVLGVAPK